MIIDVHAGQIQGARDTQEDEQGWVDTGFGLLACVADGLGGHPWGELASKMAVTTCLQQGIELCDSQSTPPKQVLQAAFARAHESIFDLCAEMPRYRGMGTTLAAIYIKDQMLYRGWVGDSLIFRLRDGVIEVLGSPWGKTSLGTDALMYGEALQIQGLDDGVPVLPGDRFLLATDGIATLELDTVSQCLADAKTPAEAVADLIRRVQWQSRPNQDNCTVLCLFVS